MRRFAVLSFALLAGCAGVTAEQPLALKLGMPRDEALATLKTQKYCPKQGNPPARLETYPRCERPGAEWGESWVTARYDEERLVEVRRYERFTDDARAVERWNQLITDRAKISTESGEATSALRARLLEPGTRTLKAFRVDASTVAGVYLLTPTPPEEASILEVLVLAPAGGAPVGHAIPKRALDERILRAFEQTPRTPTPLDEQILRALEPSPARPIGDFPSACGYGRCERSQPFGFVE